MVPAMKMLAEPEVEALFGEMEEMEGAGSVEMLREKVSEADADFESLTLMLMENFPAVVGVPVIAPVEEFRLSPAGSWLLETAQV